MNKKFSTLLAGVMLASAMSVGAQTAVQKYESNKSFLLGDGSDFISVVSDPTDPNYGKLIALPSASINTLTATNNSLWTILVTPGVNGNAPKFSYINKATGLTLSVDASKLSATNTDDPAVIGGSTSEWLNTAVTDAGNSTLAAAALKSYLNANEVAYLEKGTVSVGGGTELLVKKAKATDALSYALQVAPYRPATVDKITAEDLNTQLGTAEAGWFNLSFNRDVTSTGSNLFANTSLKAEDLNTSTPDGWVRLMAKDKKAYDKQAYIVVDTAYHKGTENSAKLVKFTYANIDEQTTGKGDNKQTRVAGSYNYKFSYDPFEDRLLVWVENYNTKAASTAAPAGGSHVTYWTQSVGGTQSAPLFIRLVELTTARELTVAGATSTNADDITNGMLTKVTIGVSTSSYVPTTVASGLYTIKLHTEDVNKAANGSFYMANLKGDVNYAISSKQDLQHMPAAQWVVEQQGNSATAPVKVTNREFGADALTLQGQLFKAGDKVFFASKDTIEFIAVDKANKEDKYLGYKHVTAEESSVETYVFNYLHGLAVDKYLNTPAGKDSIVRVDEKGGKAQFVLVPVINDDAYGYTPKNMGLAKLVRNVYYIKLYDSSKFGGETRYLTYDKAQKRYVMSVNPTPYFVKENNCVEGQHYYALLEANLATDNAPATGDYFDAQGNKLVNGDLTYLYTKEGGLILSANKPDGYEGYLFTKNAAGELAPSLQRSKSTDNRWSTSLTYATVKVSVDDASLDLTQGDLNDKFISGNGQEIRTSAFAVEKDDSPLYRRFNGVAPEAYGDAKNSPLNLKFFRYNNPAEFLAENAKATNAYRNDLKDGSISFLGVNNEFQFTEADTLSYTMFVDTAYVRNNTRMPQYLIGIRPEVVEGDTIWCNATAWHHHETLADSLACDHTHISQGFTRAMFLINAQDSIKAGNLDYQGKQAYGAAGYTRLSFKDAVHANDTLYILKDSKIATDKIDLKNAAQFADKIALDNNKHKNVVFQFRLIDDQNNRFLIESETEENGVGVFNADLTAARIAPSAGGWVKIQNGVPVIARFGTFEEAIAQAEIFDVNNEIKFAPTSNDEVAVEGVQVIAGNGVVTVQGAAGKSVVITNILGKVVAETVLTSDNATIAVPAGIVAVAVEGEEAVKTIVK